MHANVRSLTLGLAAGIVFAGIAELTWDGRARSLILPQVLLLGACAGLAWYWARPPTRWLHPVLAAAAFYAMWGAGYVLSVLLFEQAGE